MGVRSAFGAGQGGAGLSEQTHIHLYDKAHLKCRENRKIHTWEGSR